MKIFACKLEVTIESDETLISREYQNLLVFENSLEEGYKKLNSILKKRNENPKDLRKYKICNDLQEVDYILGNDIYYKKRD